jgi:hypothetical protein
MLDLLKATVSRSTANTASASPSPQSMKGQLIRLLKDTLTQAGVDPLKALALTGFLSKQSESDLCEMADAMIAFADNIRALRASTPD